MSKKILLVTDTWRNQTNGVVTTLVNLTQQAKSHGDIIHVYHTGRCKVKFNFPLYPEITVGVPNFRQIKDLLKSHHWDHIHIATLEAPLGFAFARSCKKLGLPFSASCHTKFPEFVHARFPWISVELGWRAMRYLYQDAAHVLTTTASMQQELRSHGFAQPISAWTRGVDRSIFQPNLKLHNGNVKHLLCVSRVSHEKNLDQFCSLKIPNTIKTLVGDGPYLNTLKKRYSDVHFAGMQYGSNLAAYYAAADVFVFPSRADTFGVVMLEAMACGTPVAAYPVTGPRDVIHNGVSGVLDNNLAAAVEKCLQLDRSGVYQDSLRWSWENCYQQFLDILLPATG